MPDAHTELSTAWERGRGDQGASLGPRERELFLIWDFVIDFEVGSWPDNWIGDWDRFPATIAAMRARGLVELAVLVEEIQKIFVRGAAFVRRHDEANTTFTFYEFHDTFDPEGRAVALRDMISELDDYGLPESW